MKRGGGACYREYDMGINWKPKLNKHVTPCSMFYGSSCMATDDNGNIRCARNMALEKYRNFNFYGPVRRGETLKVTGQCEKRPSYKSSKAYCEDIEKEYCKGVQSNYCNQTVKQNNNIP